MTTLMKKCSFKGFDFEIVLTRYDRMNGTIDEYMEVRRTDELRDYLSEIETLC